MDSKNKIIILITKESQVRAALDLKKRLLSQRCQDEIILLADEKVILGSRDDIKPITTYITSGSLNSEIVLRDTHAFIFNCTKEKINKGRTLQEITRYKGISLWDISIQEMLHNFGPVIKYIKIVNEIMRIEIPNRVILLGTSELLEKTTLLFCKTKNISLDIYNKDAKTPHIKVRINNFINLTIDFARSLKRFLKSLYFYIFNLMHDANISPKVLFFTVKERALDNILPVIKLFDEKERLIVDSSIPSAGLTLQSEKISFKQFYGYLLDCPVNINRINFLRRIWYLINNAESFQENLSYKGIPLWDLLKDSFHFLISDVYKEKIHRLNIMEKILSLHKPRAIVVCDSTVDILYKAKSKNISVVRMQCGHVEDIFHYGPLFFDRITVDGEYWSNILVDNRIQRSKILVTGSPRFDFIFKNRDKNYRQKKKRDLFKRLHMDHTKKLIVFVGTYAYIKYTFGLQYREFIKGVYEAVKGIEDIKLLIKMHPYEFNSKVYKEVAKKMGMEDVIIVKDIDKWDLLLGCDLLITYNSSMGYEAAVIDKPIISLEGLDRYGLGFMSEDIWNFKASGAAVWIDSLVQLRDAIEKTLFEPAFASELEKKRRRYIERHVDCLGGASLGVKKAIEEFL